MRTSPLPLVSTKEIAAVLVHAFMWLRIRARKSAGVLSMKLTVRRRAVGPQYFDVRTAIRCGSMPKLPPTEASGPSDGALTGLIFTAVSAPFNSIRFGRFLGVQTIVPSDPS